MKFHLLIFVCAICDCNVVNGLSPEDEVCQSIIGYVSSNSNNPMCEALGDCTGVSCQSATLNNHTATIIISKCTDPLEVNITMYNGSGVQILSEIVANEGNISDSGYRVDVFTRDQFAVNISVVHNADNTILVPIIEIPLNASDCMCKAIKQIGENGVSPFETECQANSDCTGQECTFDAAGTIYLLESDMLPCAKPPGFTFIVRDNINKVALTEFYFDENKNVSLLFIPFHVTVEQRNYSVIIHGVLYYSNQEVQLIPETQIILDQTKCNEQTTTIPTASPSVPNEEISPQTCQALKDIRDNTTLSGYTTCTVNDICDTVECLSFSEYDSSIQVLPCRDPPAIHFTLLDNGEEIFNKILTNSTNVSVTDVIVLIIGITQRDNAIGFKLDVILGFQPLPIISEHNITIDNCYCSDVYCSSSMPTPTNQRQPTPTNQRQPTPTNAAGSSFSLGVAVGVPVVILIVILVVIVIAIVIGVLVLKKKTGSYTKHEDDTAMSIEDNEIDGSIDEKM